MRNAARTSVLLTLILVGVTAPGVASAIPSSPRGPAPTPPSGLTVLIAGDSVPLHLEGALAAVLDERLGWNLVSATVPACSIYGEALGWPNGTHKGDPDRCPGRVGPTQSSMVAAHDPDVVIWWDRLSTMPFFTAEQQFVKANSERFWQIRRRDIAETLERLRAGGATVVFVGTEPMGTSFSRCRGSLQPWCVWWRYRVRHYRDITRPLTRWLHLYADAHPEEAAFISITDTICRWDVSPCDDTMPNGELARPDGTHYKGGGELLAARALVRDMRAALYPS